MAYPDPPTTPPIPQRGDRATFSERVDAFLTWVAAIIPWLQGYLSDFMSKLTALASGGAYAIPYRFSYLSTGLGSGGEVQYPSSGSSLYVDTTDVNGVSVGELLASMAANASSTIKGQIRLVQVNEPTKYMVFNVTSYEAVAGYATFTVTRIDGGPANTFAEGSQIVLTFQKSGDKGDAGTVPYMRVTDTKAQQLSGGDAVSGSQTRSLNTIDYNDIPGATLGNSRVSLPAGTYEFDIRVPGTSVDHVARLRNFTDSVDVFQGSPVLGAGNSWIRGRLTITSQKQFAVLHTFSQAAANGLGRSTAGGGGLSVYTDVVIRKVL